MKYHKLTEEGTRTTQRAVSGKPYAADTEPSGNECAISTPEEARKAIIWSEILNRKY